MNNFDYAIEQLLGKPYIENDGEEGGYINDPDDTGGETKFGISRRIYPDLDIKNLTEEKAREIYKRDYWEFFHLDEIESPDLARKMLLLIVHMGGLNAIRCLQRASRACGYYITEDGRIGPETINVTRRADQPSLLAALKSEAAGMYRVFIALDPVKKKYRKNWEARAYR